MTVHVADDILGRFARQQHDLFERVRKGSLNPEKAMKLMQTLIDGGQFPIWKTINLGTGLETADDFRTALKDSGHHIGDWGNDILSTSAFQQSLTDAVPNTSLDLCVATVKELTGKDKAFFSEIITAVKQVGELLPAWAGPLLRLQYPDQPKGEWLHIAMEPITNLDGGLSVFSVDHSGDGLSLYCYTGHPDDVWNGGNRFVFLRRKPVCR